MKNRLISLVLCLLMLASVALTGCSGKSNDEVQSEIEKEQSESARTMTMWMVSEKEVDAETCDRITKAVNNMTESKFKVRMVLNFLTDEEYRSVVTETIRKKEDSKSIFTSDSAAADEEETTAADENATVQDETVTDTYGRVTIKYPDLTPNQVDLIYVQGEEMFREYVANGWLSQLDEELSASSKKIKEYVSQTLLASAKLDGGTYAIPNNCVIGDYTYMLIRKDLAQELGTDAVYAKGDINGFFNSYVYSFLENVRTKHSDVLPIGADYDEVLALLAHYWSIDADTYEAESERFSLLGYRYTDPKTLSRGNTILSFDSLLADENFRKAYYELNQMKMKGGYYLTDGASDENAAIRFTKGGLEDYQAYLSEDSAYLPVIVKYPSVDVEDVYENMFGVCSYSTVELSRCMQILTYLTTNADFRNLLQYGILGEDYELTEVDLVEDGETVKYKVATRIQDKYVMNIFKTGNAFIAHPSADMSANVWEIGKQQNRDALIEPLLNFDFAALAAASGATSASTPKVDSSGYTYTWTTGYSREVLSQNSILKTWMDAADQAGKGVYVLHTCASNSGQNLSATVYYYNNNIGGAKVDVTDDKNGTLNVAYNGTAGNSYEITVIEFYGKKNSSRLNWNYTVNGGSSAGAVVKYRNAKLTFNAFDTETYAISFRQGMTKSMIAQNAAALDWVKSKTGSSACLGTYVADNSVGGKTYTYLFYLPTLTTGYNVSVLPSGTDKALKLTLDYTADSTKKNESGYALFLLTVRADADVTIDLVVNGLTTVNETLTEDPKLALCGALDTELVKYFADLTKKVEDLVAEAASKDATKENLDALKTLIDDLGTLFTVKANGAFSDDLLQAELAEALESDAVKTFAESLDLAEFYFNLLAATSKSEVHHQEPVFDTDGGDTGKLQDSALNIATGEAYYYYQSPYMIYYAWLKSNGLAK